MSKTKLISMLLNEVWISFMEVESSIVETENLQTMIEPSEDDQSFFTILLKSCQKDMENYTTEWSMPKSLMYWRHSHGEKIFTIGWLDRDDCVTSFYTIDKKENIEKRWPKNPTHFQMFNP